MEKKFRLPWGATSLRKKRVLGGTSHKDQVLEY